MAHGGDELVLEPVQRVALADVAEAEHRAGEAALVEDRGQEVLGRERGAVGPVDGVFAGLGGVAFGGAEQHAILGALAVGRRGAVQQVVDRLAGEVGGRCAEQAGSRGIGEADHAVPVCAADAVGH